MKLNENGGNGWETSTLNAYLNGEYYAGLSSSAKKMIKSTKTYLGGGRFLGDNNYGTAEDIYAWERGTDRYDEKVSLSYVNNISLMYPSDYAYTYANGVDDVCYNDVGVCGDSSYGEGWISNISSTGWTISPFADYYDGVFEVFSESISHIYTAYSRQMQVIPVVYLKPNVSFLGNHTGSFQDHYILKN